jgi:hypothetical protein
VPQFVARSARSVELISAELRRSGDLDLSALDIWEASAGF